MRGRHSRFRTAERAWEPREVRFVVRATEHREAKVEEQHGAAA